MASRTTLLSQAILVYLVTLSWSWQLFPDSEVGDYSEKCADALATNITSCIPAVGGISTDTFYSQHALDVICKTKCRDELRNYEKAVTEQCRGVFYTNDWGTENPISAVASTLVFNFDQVCLKNEGQYCNLVLGNLTQNGGDECNKCLLLQLRDQAQFPYGSGPGVYSSVYPSFTSSCKFTGYPATVSPRPSSSPYVLPITCTAPVTNTEQQLFHTDILFLSVTHGHRLQRHKIHNQRRRYLSICLQVPGHRNVPTAD